MLRISFNKEMIIDEYILKPLEKLFRIGKTEVTWVNLGSPYSKWYVSIKSLWTHLKIEFRNF